MKHTDIDRKKKIFGSDCSSSLEKLEAEDDLSMEDYYRILIWNSILEVKNTESLRYLVNAAMTFSHRERAGYCDTTRSFSEFISSEEETKRLLSGE